MRSEASRGIAQCCKKVRYEASREGTRMSKACAEPCTCPLSAFGVLHMLHLMQAHTLHLLKVLITPATHNLLLLHGRALAAALECVDCVAGGVAAAGTVGVMMAAQGDALHACMLAQGKRPGTAAHDRCRSAAGMASFV